MDLFSQIQNAGSAGTGCREVLNSEDYRGFLVDYALGWGNFPEGLTPACVLPLGQNQAVIFLDRSDVPLGAGRLGGYSALPKCYGLLGTEALEAAGVLRQRRSPLFGLRGQGALVGIVDTGVDAANPLFRYENGETKIAALWDQTGSGTSPDIYPFGREWSREEIDEALQRRAAGASAAEAPLPEDAEGHGTFLAAVAAGRETGDFSGVAPDCELAVVKLRQARGYLREFYSIPENVWACQEDDVMMGIRYLIAAAARLQRPIALCLGIGTNLGGHRGAGALSRYLSSYSLYAGVSFHIAAGNEGIAGHHYRGNIEEGREEAEVDFNVGEGEEGFVMELWSALPDTFQVGFLSPGGERVERLNLRRGEFRRVEFFPEKTGIEVRDFPGDTVSGDPVVRMNFRTPVSGVWKLFVYGEEEGNRAFDLYLPLSNFLKEDTRFLRADASDTVTSPADAVSGIAYAPYDVQTGSLYVRASRGYTADGRVKPDLAAPGVAYGVPGTTVGSALPEPDPEREVKKSGSSIAAAFGAGIGALLQEWAFVKENDITMNGQNLRFYLLRGADREESRSYPNPEWGYGTVNLYNALLSIRR